MRRQLTLLGLAAAFTSGTAIDTADIDVYVDYACGLWAVAGTANFDTQDATRAHSYQKAIKVTMPANTVVQFNHTWEGQLVQTISHVEFWIYATDTAAANMNVQVRVTGNPRTAARIGNYANIVPNSWSLVRVPISALNVQPNEHIQVLWLKAPGTPVNTFWLDDVKLTKPAVASTVLTMNASDRLRQVDKKMFGIGTYTWDWELGSSATISAVRDAGISFLNFPGGTSSDVYDWRNNRDRHNGAYGYVNTTQYLAIADAMGADRMITANYGSGTPQEAADWLHFTNVENNGNVIYWSIGNECYGGYDERPPPYRNDPETYAAFVRDCIVLMKAIDPRVKIGIVGTWSEWDYPSRTTVVNPRTGQQQTGWGPVILTKLREWGTLPDYYDIHIYPMPPGTESDATILQMANRPEWIINYVRPMLTDYLGEYGTNLPIHVTETNSTWMPIGKQSTSLTGALYLADFWGSVAKTGLQSFVWWNLHNPVDPNGNFHPSLYGWRTAPDFGILSLGRPVGIAPPVNSRYPTFYAFKLLKLFVRPGDTLVRATSNNELLSVHGSISPQGKVRMLVINKAKNTDIRASLNLSGMAVPRTARVYRYGQPEDLSGSDISVSNQFLTVPLFSSRMDRTMLFPRYSITVIELDAPVKNIAR